MMKFPQQARLEDVAIKAGVSSMTVSRAIRHPEKVSQRVRKRVEKAIEEVGYVPNRIAGSLASNKTNIVVALVPNLGNPVFASTIYGMIEALRRHDLNLMIGNTGHSLQEEERLLKTFLALRPCGFFLHETRHTATTRRLMLNSGIPIVEAGNLIKKPLDSVVSYSNTSAAREMTLHLASRGYRRIGFVGSFAVDRVNSRHRGYVGVLQEMELSVVPELTIDAPPTVDGGVGAIAQLVTRKREVDSVLFAHVSSAIGGIMECQRRGIAIPKHIAVASFDDDPLASHLVPTLTTVRIPRYEIGRQAARVLLDRLQGATAQSVDVGYSVEVRNST